MRGKRSSPQPLYVRLVVGTALQCTCLQGWLTSMPLPPGSALLCYPSEVCSPLSCFHDAEASTPNCFRWLGVRGHRVSPPLPPSLVYLMAEECKGQLSLAHALGHHSYDWPPGPSLLFYLGEMQRQSPQVPLVVRGKGKSTSPLNPLYITLD